MAEGITANGVGSQAARRVSRVRLFIRVLGVTVFSLLSLGIAFYAFTGLSQVQDLFFDARPYVIQGIVYWTGFYVAGIFLWALPLVFTARLLVMQNYDTIGIDTEERFNFYVFRLPGYYLILAYIFVFAGIIAAGANLPAPTGGNAAEGQLRPYLEHHLLVLFAASALVLILVIIHDVFLRGYGRWIERLERRNPMAFKKSLMRFERVSRKTTVDLDTLDLHLSALKPAFLSTETWIQTQRVKAFMWRYLSGVSWVLLFLVAAHFVSYSDMVGHWLSSIDLKEYPDAPRALQLLADTLWLKRATFLFVLFGAWLPFVAIMAMLSNRYQFPFITLIAVVTTALTLFISDGHDVRVVTIAKQDRDKLRPLAFTAAVQNWKIASGWMAKGCDSLAEGAVELAACPRPIVVAGEGGGSRAAFLIASVLGNLQDRSIEEARINSAARTFDQQLFAISSVSGSSVGAAFYIAALRAHPAATADPMKAEFLKRALYQQRLWFLNVANTGTKNERFLDNVVTYKDALQASLSNDFISPALIAFLARDVLTLSRLPDVMDRAGVLETAWEDAFDGVYGSKNDRSLLEEPFLSMAPRDGAWTPLLFFNTTSVETGRRAIVTPIELTGLLPDGKPLLIDAYDVHEFFCSSKADDDLRVLDRIGRVLPAIFSRVAHMDAPCVKGKPRAIDIRLSTAAGISSRSPFVSPHANVRDSTGQVVDSVVDGGYFDNSGAVTALEIASGLKRVDSRILPFILQISSEPDWFKGTKNCGSGERFSDRPEVPDEADFKPLGTLGNLLTVNATRISRGYETIIETPDNVRQLNGGKLISDAQVYVCPQPKESFFLDYFLRMTQTAPDRKETMRARSKDKTTQAQSAIAWKSVSLSWWLSPPLQAYLDGQIYSPQNRNARDCTISLLRDRSAEEIGRCG